MFDCSTIVFPKSSCTFNVMFIASYIHKTKGWAMEFHNSLKCWSNLSQSMFHSNITATICQSSTLWIFTNLQFKFLNSFFNLHRVLGLSNRSFPHAVGQQSEEPLHNLQGDKSFNSSLSISTYKERKGDVIPVSFGHPPYLPHTQAGQLLKHGELKGGFSSFPLKGLLEVIGVKVFRFTKQNYIQVL